MQILRAITSTLGTPYGRGVLMIAVSALFLSTSGVALRAIDEAGGWQILFFRSFAFSITVFLYLTFKKDVSLRAEIASLKWNDFLVVVFMATGFLAYVFALLHTTVANAVFIIGAAPLLMAFLGWLVLRERVSGRTWLAIVGAIAGLIIIVTGEFSGGRYLGNLIALWIPISYAFTVILIRKSQRTHMLAALLLAGILAMVLSAMFVPTFAVSRHDLLISFYLGIFQVGLGFILLFLGARYVPAAQVGLIGLIETICAPIWVWVTVDEMPSMATLFGGLIILASIVSNGMLSIIGPRKQK